MGATAQVDTGHGASITLGTTAGTWKCRKIEPGTKSLPTVDTTYLATANMRTKMVGDLYDWTKPKVTILVQGTQGLPALGVAETITITFPIPSSGTVGATLIGTGILTDVTWPSLETNTLQEGTLEWTWDGATPPAYTAAI